MSPKDLGRLTTLSALWQSYFTQPHDLVSCLATDFAASVLVFWDQFSHRGDKLHCASVIEGCPLTTSYIHLDMLLQNMLQHVVLCSSLCLNVTLIYFYHALFCIDDLIIEAVPGHMRVCGLWVQRLVTMARMHSESGWPWLSLQPFSCDLWLIEIFSCVIQMLHSHPDFLGHTINYNYIKHICIRIYIYTWLHM